MSILTRCAARGMGVCLVVMAIGCHPAELTQPYDPSKIIETDRGYRQDGHLLSSNDLWKKLEQEPGVGGHVRRAEVLELTSGITAAVGGGLIGWPIGAAAGGAADPHWELAAIGGGVLAVSIAIGVWGASSRQKAISVHNDQVGLPGRLQMKAAQAYYEVPGSPLIVGANSVGVVW
jgi:hypothetical protein